MASTPEGRVKAKVKQFFKNIGAWYYMPVQNGMGVVGIPDFIACIGGRFVAVETKAPGREGATTANQDMQLGLIHDAGGCAVVVSDVDTLKQYLRANGFQF